MHYQDLDCAFLGGELIDLIGERIEEKRLNAPDIVLPSALLGPSTKNLTKIEIMSIETS